MEYYAKNISDVLAELKTSERGLSTEEAERRLKLYGFNELKKEKRITPFIIFINQFKNALILLLVLAGILSLVLGEIVEAIAIFVILLMNAVLGFIQEYKAEKAIAALEKISAPTAKVIRDGVEQKIPAKNLVPGDIILLEAGDIVSADSRIIEFSSLQIDESSLTGESVSSIKTNKVFKIDTSVADQENMAFMGTVVTYGKGKCVVTSTGMKTEFGKIATSLQTTKEVKTPLQIKFEKLAKQIGIIAVILIMIVLIAGTLQGALTFNKMILFALALTVAIVPNALPLVVTLGLALGTKNLARKNMLIRKLPAAESLGAATIICSDKTGTITKNQMTVTDILFDNQDIKVSGIGYEPNGNFYLNNKQINSEKLDLLLRIGYLCNNAKLTEKDGRFEIIGDPTEGSLIVLGKKGKLDDEFLKKNFVFIEELPFDSDRKMMSVIFKNKINGKNEVYVKGAPDVLLSKCDKIFDNGKIRNLTKKDLNKILEKNNLFAQKALRVLALAYREIGVYKKYEIKNVEKNLVFVGLVGMIDPPRDEIKYAVEKCKEAGIKVMIITGDHALTTKAIAQQIGLFEKGDLVLTGEEIDRMSDHEIEEKIEKIRIIARALPIQKLRVVNALQKKGHIVAMTGDGVNDAPALKKADIGIAMGITGTDVAKEVSKAVLVDDNFATIVNAIEEGRNIYDKIIKSTRFFLSCNTGEITSVFLAILMKLPLPLLPLQILMMNLLTDNFPAIGLSLESVEKDIMKRPPKNPKENPISKKMFLSILFFGLIMGLGTLFMFLQYVEENLAKAQTVAFTTLVMFQMFAVLSSRTLHPSLKNMNLFSNKWLFGAVCLSILLQIAVIHWSPLQFIFDTVSLSAKEWTEIILISAFGFIVMEVSKFFSTKVNTNSL